MVVDGGGVEERERVENEGRRENFEVELPWMNGVESGGFRREKVRDIFFLFWRR